MNNIIINIDFRLASIVISIFVIYILIHITPLVNITPYTYIHIYICKLYIYCILGCIESDISSSLLFTPVLQCHIYNTSGAHPQVQYVLSRFIVFKILILWYYSCKSMYVVQHFEIWLIYNSKLRISSIYIWIFNG